MKNVSCWRIPRGACFASSISRRTRWPGSKRPCSKFTAPEFTTDHRKHETLARLQLSLKVLEAEGQSADFLREFIRKLEPWKP